MKSAFLYLFVFWGLMLSSCKDEGLGPGQSGDRPVDFSVLLTENDLPDSLVTVLPVRDVLRVSANEMLLVSNFNLYRVKDGQPALLFPGVMSLYRAGDLIVALGYYVPNPNHHTVLYISRDGGQTFVIRERVLLDHDVNIGLSFYYNGVPDQVLLQKTNAGKYIMVLTNEFDYDLGGTGFSIKNWTNFYLSSTDGLNWQVERVQDVGGQALPLAVDRDGVIHYRVQRTDSQTYTIHDYYTSPDYGLTMDKVSLDMACPNLITANGSRYVFNRYEANGSYPHQILVWNGKDWDEQSIRFSGQDIKTFIIDRVHETNQGKILLIGYADGIRAVYISG